MTDKATDLERLVKERGGVFVRYSGNAHKIYRLNGRQIVLPVHARGENLYKKTRARIEKASKECQMKIPEKTAYSDMSLTESTTLSLPSVETTATPSAEVASSLIQTESSSAPAVVTKTDMRKRPRQNFEQCPKCSKVIVKGKMWIHDKWAHNPNTVRKDPDRRQFHRPTRYEVMQGSKPKMPKEKPPVASDDNPFKVILDSVQVMQDLCGELQKQIQGAIAAHHNAVAETNKLLQPLIEKLTSERAERIGRMYK